MFLMNYYLVAKPVRAAPTIPISIPPKLTRKNDRRAFMKSFASKFSGPILAIAANA